MRTHNTQRADPGWRQFERMVLGGVPHALTIARALSRSTLTVPSAPLFDAAQADLSFYAPVHQAYRLSVLGRFLIVMETLRPHPLWKHLKASRGAQLLIVEDCLVSDFETRESIVSRIDDWFHQALAELADTHPFATNPFATGPATLFHPNSRAA